MLQKQLTFTTMLSNLLVIIIAVALIISTKIFLEGQIAANRAIVDAGTAILNSVSSNNSTQTSVVSTDYSAAIAYLEAAQQTYSENSVIKITSLIYALSSSIILGYGAKMLRLGAIDKQELCTELLEKTAEQFNKSSDKILQHQNNVYTAIISCENAAQLALLLLSHFELTNSLTTVVNSDIEDRLQVELTRSLQQFRDFLEYSQQNKNGNELTEDQLKMINQSWSQAKRAVNEYVFPKVKNAISCLERSFGKYDQKAIEDLVKEIEKHLANLSR